MRSQVERRDDPAPAPDHGAGRLTTVDEQLSAERGDVVAGATNGRPLLSSPGLRMASRILAATVVGVCAWPLFAFSLRHYLPVIDNDEVIYFLQVKTFLVHGFHGGNFFLNDQVPASRIHFGLHGPAFVTLYGLLASVIGWHNYSPYVANLLLFLTAWLLLNYSLVSQPRKRIAIAAFVLLHGHFFLLLPSMMQESFHLSVAVMMAALWHLALERRSLAAWTALAALTVIAMLTRYTWGLTVPFYVFSLLQQRFRTESRGWAATLAVGMLSMIAGAAMTYGAMRIWVFWTAPANVGFLPAVSLRQTLHNLGGLFSFDVIPVFVRYPVYFRVSTSVLLAGFMAVAVIGRSAASRIAATYSLLLLALPMLAQAAFYTVDGYRDFRVLASFHTLAGLVFLSRVDLRLPRLDSPIRAVAAAAGVIVVSAINTSLTVEAVRSRYQLAWQRLMGPEVDRSAKLLFMTMGTHMQVAAGDTSFCKTVYGPVEVTDDPRLIHLPFGLGFSAVVPNGPDTLPSLKGKYALLYNEPSAFKQLFDASRDWQLVGWFHRYCLYRSTVNCADAIQ